MNIVCLFVALPFLLAVYVAAGDEYERLLQLAKEED